MLEMDEAAQSRISLTLARPDVSAGLLPTKFFGAALISFILEMKFMKNFYTKSPSVPGIFQEIPPHPAILGLPKI
jgi:hypothetical protein